jgi:hypothetical protein
MNVHRFILAFSFLPLLLLAPLSAAADDDAPSKTGSRGTYLLRSSVMGAAGATGTSTNFGEKGTLGQPTPVGTGTSTSFELYAGFWTSERISTDVPEDTPQGVFRNALQPNTPNPFNPATTIRYELGETAPVQITIYNIHGQVVRRLLDEPRSPGSYSLVWNGRDEGGASAASGVYFCRLQVGGFTDVKKMVLIK